MNLRWKRKRIKESVKIKAKETMHLICKGKGKKKNEDEDEMMILFSFSLASSRHKLPAETSIQSLLCFGYELISSWIIKITFFLVMELKDEGLRLKWMERRWEIQLSIKWVDLEEKREKIKNIKKISKMMINKTENTNTNWSWIKELICYKLMLSSIG